MLTISYDGSNFLGWQVQPGSRTVQGSLEYALNKIFKENIRVTGAGRTDTGVHAFAQVAAFTTFSEIPADSILKALNSILPEDISIMKIEDAPHAFNPRHSAKAKTYIYAISNSSVRNPLLSRYALHIRHALDTDSMMKAASFFIGEHDFESFMGVGTKVKTTLRNIMMSEITVRNDMVYYTVKGSGFLRHMVRNIVGTVIEVGKKRLTPDDIILIIEAKDRSQAGPTAPPQGLYLVSVEY